MCHNRNTTNRWPKPVRYLGARSAPRWPGGAPPLTDWEQTLQGPVICAQCATVVESVMAGEPGFASLGGMFDAETATVFVDQNAHVAETGNRQIARRLAELLVPLLARPGSVESPSAR